MKKFARFLILALMLSALLCVSAFAEDTVAFENIADGATFTMDASGEKFDVTYTGATSGKQYLILMVDMTDDVGNYEIAATAIQYVNQDAATDSGISFTVYPKNLTKSVVLLAGGDQIQVLGHVKPAGVKVSGTVTSFLEGDTTVKLMKDGTAVQTATVSSTTGTYEFNSVPAGTYALEISKANHVTRTYEIVVGAEAVTQDVKIHPVGDVSGDGQIKMNDYISIKQHAQKKSSLTGYELLCADISGDGQVKMNDYISAKQHAQKKNFIW